MQRLRKLKGFTLIELIVVVIIIGILAAVASLAYNKFIGDARVNAAKVSAKQVANKLTALAAQSADGDTVTYVKGSTVSALKTALGVDPADVNLQFYKAADGAAVIADADLGTATSVFVGTKAHNCEIKLAETATIGVCK